MTVFDTALATLHADPNVAIWATFKRQGRGIATAVQVIREIIDGDPEAFGQPVNARNDTLQIRVTDAATVGKGDVLDLYDGIIIPASERTTLMLNYEIWLGNYELSLPTAPPDTAAVRYVVTDANLDHEGLTWTARVRRM